MPRAKAPPRVKGPYSERGELAFAAGVLGYLVALLPVVLIVWQLTH